MPARLTNPVGLDDAVCVDPSSQPAECAVGEMNYDIRSV